MAMFVVFKCGKTCRIARTEKNNDAIPETKHKRIKISKILYPVFLKNNFTKHATKNPDNILA
jgi:hypothetical protein